MLRRIDGYVVVRYESAENRMAFSRGISVPASLLCHWLIFSGIHVKTSFWNNFPVLIAYGKVFLLSWVHGFLKPYASYKRIQKRFSEFYKCLLRNMFKKFIFSSKRQLIKKKTISSHLKSTDILIRTFHRMTQSL